MNHEEYNSSLKTWLRKVLNKKNKPTVFGVSLTDSLHIAHISIAYETKETIIGSIPIIVAKCGAYLKDQGLYVEGVFRKSGNARRLGELQHSFNSSPDYGKGLSWEGYTVHDAANILRRYLCYLPEPVIVNHLYDPFRNIIASDSLSTVDKTKAIQALINQLPLDNQYLLFYLLDLISLFSKYSEYTKMTSLSLASVFTPGLILNTEHVMNPTHYKLSQQVIYFLIEHQHQFHLFRSTPTRYRHQSITSNQQEKHLLRANTDPVKKKRFGVDDPVQVI
ncbi:Rho GTPase activation protein, partial [Pilobolus umbonatus]